MTNEEMEQALAQNGVATADIEKVQGKFDAEKITEIVEGASNPKEAFETLHAFYPELEVEALQKQCDFVMEQVESAMKDQNKNEPIELTDDELENVAGGGFCDWFKKNWKAVAIGAAIVVGAALICTGVGAAIGAVVAQSAAAASSASLLSTLSAAGISATISADSIATIVTAGAVYGASVGAGVGVAAGGITTGVLAGTGNLPN